MMDLIYDITDALGAESARKTAQIVMLQNEIKDLKAEVARLTSEKTDASETT